MAQSKTYHVDEIRKTYASAYAPWTREDDEALRNTYTEIKTSSDVTDEYFFTDYAKKVGRKPGAIRSRIEKLLQGKIPQYKDRKMKTMIKHVPGIEEKPTPGVSKLDFNQEFRKAYDLMEETDKNIFLTGRAGTGKSTLLEYFRTHTKKKVVVLAPTGVAALNVHGQTIHSFFKFKPDITLQTVKRKFKKEESDNLYKRIDIIIIDEISMVRADLFDCVDKFLRLNRFNRQPFGGVQMIFIGDLYQLPPVVTGSEREIFRTHYKSQYFFDAKAMEGLRFEFIELEKVYRQKDDSFIQLLNAVRNNSATDEHLKILNERFMPEFIHNPNQFMIHLTTTNKQADEINAEHLARLKSKLHTFAGNINGMFDKKSLPTDIKLSVKVDSQVMMLNNDSQGRWVNGSIGKITDIEESNDEEAEETAILVEFPNGKVEIVNPHTWELFQFSFDQENNNLRSDIVATFRQYPLRLAWAVTIHKSQGKTFDTVNIDIGNGTFAHGQLYVALSRCRSLQGITLKKLIAKKHIFMDWRVVKFVTSVQYRRSDEELPIEEKIRVLRKAVDRHSSVQITYLKSNDEKSYRRIKPFKVGEMEYLGRKFEGVSAYDEKRGVERVFRIDRILKMESI